MGIAARILVVGLIVLMLVPGWTGEAPRPRLGDTPQMTVRPVALDPRNPARRTVGRLRYSGGFVLSSRDAAFGGFSALAVTGDRFLLLADTGNWVAFRMTGDGRPFGLRFGDVPGGPGSGWEKRDRDTESLTRDPRRGTIWIGFERANAIWRYDAVLRRAERAARPRAMARWDDNGGPESLVRLADGRFLVVAEHRVVGLKRDMRAGLLFLADPTEAPWPAFRFAYRPARGYDVADVAQLPDGRLVVLERRFTPPFRFSSRIALVRRGSLRANAVVTGETLARLASPLIHDNFEGIAAICEAGRTVVWLVSDDNQSILQRSLLVKFALPDAPCSTHRDASRRPTQAIRAFPEPNPARPDQ